MLRHLIFGVLLLLPGLGLRAETPVLDFGVVPQQSASKMARQWSPVLEWLSRQSGVQLRFRTAPNIPTFERRLAAGEYDLAYMNPYHYVVFARKPGYRAIAREKDKRMQGIVVTRKDSPLRSIEQLQGQAVAFPSPAAFAATLLPQGQLRRSGVAFKEIYVGSHDSVYRAVAKGLYPAGGGIVRTLNNIEPAVRDQLRILSSTDPYIPHAIAYHPRVDRDLLRRLTEAMLAMHLDPEGRRWLAALNFKGLEAAEDREWDDIRALDLHLLDHLLTE